MNFQIRISLALLFSAWMATSACGQFPWSGGKDAAPEARKTGSITWKSDLPEALKLAREQRKLVFLHFSGTHCPPCRKLEDNVLNRNDVAVTMLSRFVPVFIVVEEAESLVERFHVQSWPTDVIIDADGREIARHVSPQNPQEFIKRISTISAKHHAGQSTTMANVRAAVASDVTEASTPVQQTAADDRLATPTQPPRAESKVVRNPHTPDSRLPPIVARNNKPKKATVRSGDREDEGFSPPSERRKPVIVRKSEEPKQVATLDKDEEEPADEELANDEPAAEANAEGDVAPWRKNLMAKKAAKRVEVANEPEAKEVPAEEPAEEMELETAPDEAKAEKTAEPAAETEAEVTPESKSEKSADEKAPVEANTAEEELVADANKSEKPVEQEVTDELPAPRSRFGATKAEESPSEEETPEREQTAEPPAKSEEEASDETEAPKTAEPALEEPAPKKKATDAELADEESKETARPKSRFSGGDDEETKSDEKTPATPESGEPAEEAAAEPHVKQEVAPPAEEKTEEEAPKGVEGSTEAAEAMPESEATEEAPPESEEAPVKEAPKKTAPKAVAKKAKKPVEAPSEEPEAKADEAAAELADSARPRGLAKIARSGKYVLGGHCCVTLLENETLKKGNPKLGAIHRGRIYLFATADARKKFLGNPDDYSPMLTGYDPVLYADNGELVDGSAEILAKLHDGRVVTFSSEDTYKRFAADYKKLREKSPYVEATRSAMKETNGGRHFR